jgi:hemoglobin
MTNPSPPTLFEWVGGMPALETLTARFYEAVKADDLIGPVFAHMSGEHPRFVAAFIAEVFGGPTHYSETRGGHAHMIKQHLERHLTQAQRERWISLLLTTANEAGIPDDPEFRSALVAYLEWGSRLAVLNSQDGVEAPAESPMPKWGWGVPGGPYQP